MTPHPPLIDPVLLDQLLRAENHVPTDALRTGTDGDAAQVRRELDRLRQTGCRLDVHPQRGVQLVEAGLGCWTDYLEHRRLGRAVEVYQSIGSTQDAARRMVESRGIAADGGVVVADDQTAGRGRLGRRWFSAPGKCILFTRVAMNGEPERPDGGHECPDDAPKSVDHLTFLTAVAVARGIESVAGRRRLHVAVKWPNDLLVDGRKIAGILVETFAFGGRRRRATAAIIGVGINVGLRDDDLPAALAAEWRGQITSLALCGCIASRLGVLAEVLDQLDAAMHESVDALLADWRQRCTMLAQPAQFLSGGQRIHGRVVDLDPYDGLIVRTDTGTLVHLTAATTTT